MHSLVEDGVAQKDTRLKVGDKLVSVNGTSVVNHSLQVNLHLSEVVHPSPPPPLPFCSPPLPPLPLRFPLIFLCFPSLSSPPHTFLLLRPRHCFPLYPSSPPPFSPNLSSSLSSHFFPSSFPVCCPTVGDGSPGRSGAAWCEPPGPSQPRDQQFPRLSPCLLYGYADHGRGFSSQPQHSVQCENMHARRLAHFCKAQVLDILPTQAV